MRLETSGGARKFRTFPISGGVTERYFFDLSPGDKDPVLKIPYLMAFTDESRTVALPVPPLVGHKVVVNEKVEFEDATMTIVDVEKSHHQTEDLAMTLKYDSKRPNIVMHFARLEPVDGHSGIGSWGGSGDPTGTHITSVNYRLEDGQSTLRLKISPVYYLLDEYSLKLEK
jgi:hypothetical protein